MQDFLKDFSQEISFKRINIDKLVTYKILYENIRLLDSKLMNENSLRDKEVKAI